MGIGAETTYKGTPLVLVGQREPSCEGCTFSGTADCPTYEDGENVCASSGELFPIWVRAEHG